MKSSKNIVSKRKETEELGLAHQLALGYLPLKKDLVNLLTSVIQIFKNQYNLLTLSSPLTILGDIHGQFQDLVKILNSLQKDQRILFLGDYVDRGDFSVQVMILLCSMKKENPNRIFMLRGNHQSQEVTTAFSFRREAIHKYDQDIYSLFVELFYCLPLGAVVDHQFFCVHGGISKGLNLTNFNKINRFMQIPEKGFLCDILWSDPLIKDPHAKFSENSERGCSVYYGSQAIEQFVEENKLISIIRGHEVMKDGYKFYKWEEDQSFPKLITIFSAPNYCNYYKNRAASLTLLGQNKFVIKQYKESQNRMFDLPNNLSLFELSSNYLCKLVNQIFLHLIRPSEKQHKKKVSICKSLLTLSSQRITLNETHIKLKQEKLSNKQNFQQIKALDLSNERRIKNF